MWQRSQPLTPFMPRTRSCKLPHQPALALTQHQVQRPRSLQSLSTPILTFLATTKIGVMMTHPRTARNWQTGPVGTIYHWYTTRNSVGRSIRHGGKKDYSPDQCWVTTVNAHSQQVSSTVLGNFPHSQHRPLLIHVGLQLPVIHSSNKLRWNLRKANWPLYSDLSDRSIPTIPV